MYFSQFAAISCYLKLSLKKEDEFGDLEWDKTCNWLLLARGNLTQFHNDPVIG